MVILKVEHLFKAFGGLQATSDVNFEMKSGEISAIIGPNGAGKSTLFNLLTGYHRVDAGSVFFREKNITNWPPYKIARLGIARAFQISNIYALTTSKPLCSFGWIAIGIKRPSSRWPFYQRLVIWLGWCNIFRMNNQTAWCRINSHTFIC